jgi:hypothetical protein
MKNRIIIKDISPRQFVILLKNNICIKCWFSYEYKEYNYRIYSHEKTDFCEIKITQLPFYSPQLLKVLENKKVRYCSAIRGYSKIKEIFNNFLEI